jgi:hypothetical protein
MKIAPGFSIVRRAGEETIIKSRRTGLRVANIFGSGLFRSGACKAKPVLMPPFSLDT